MFTLEILPWIFLIVGGYFLGGVMFSRLICMLFFKKDICKISGDGNPGAANVFWHCGKVAGVFSLLLDMLKGFLPVFIAIKYLDINNPLFALVMFAPVLGHAFSIFHDFNGGKCISTIYGVLTALFITWTSPIMLPILGIMNLIFQLFIKSIPGRQRAYFMFSVLALVFLVSCLRDDQVSIALGGASISLLAIVKHSPLFAKDTKKSKRRAGLVK